MVDIAPKAYPPHHQKIMEALQSVDFERITSRKEVEERLAETVREKPVIQFLVKNLYWEREDKLNWRFNLKVLAEKYGDFVGKAIRFGIFEG